MITKITITMDNDTSAYETDMTDDEFAPWFEKIMDAILKRVSEKYPNADVTLIPQRVISNKVSCVSDIKGSLDDIEGMIARNEEEEAAQRDVLEIMASVYEKYCNEEL